jgi:hypothetical protein
MGGAMGGFKGGRVGALRPHVGVIQGLVNFVKSATSKARMRLGFGKGVAKNAGEVASKAANHQGPA